MLVQFEARVAFPGKTRNVHSGYRPTFSIEGKRGLCNVESVTPEPLEPGCAGSAVMTVSWDWNTPKIVEGTSFLMFEGERQMGEGTVTHVLQHL